MSQGLFEFGKGKGQTFKKRKSLTEIDILNLPSLLENYPQNDLCDLTSNEIESCFEIGVDDVFNDTENSDGSVDFDFKGSDMFEEIPFDMDQNDDIFKLPFNDYVSGAKLIQGGSFLVIYIYIYIYV